MPEPSKLSLKPTPSVVSVAMKITVGLVAMLLILGIGLPSLLNSSNDLLVIAGFAILIFIPVAFISYAYFLFKQFSNHNPSSTEGENQ